MIIVLLNMNMNMRIRCLSQECIDQFSRDNDPIVKTEAVNILVKLLTNVINHPGELKYRQVRLGNKTIEEKLLPASGAFEVLFSCGFEETDDKLVLPLDTPDQILKDFLRALQNLDAPKPPTPAATPSAPAPTPSTSTPLPTAQPQPSTSSSSSSSNLLSSDALASALASVSTPPSSNLLMPDVLARESEFQNRVISQLSHMDSYEQLAARASALEVMPVSRFEKAARAKLDAAKEQGEEVPDALYKDFLLLEMKEWFKTDFFKWLDSPPCPVCGGATEGGGLVAPTPQERADGAGRVEGWRCKTAACGGQARFPRYHSKPEVLLRTRQGRCGEWANCFVLCCRALDFDTRMVVDWTDHVWAEVWSEVENRWLHVDPGEAVDSCLVYEVGWGKKLTYVIAHSKDEVQDVTWRYSKNHEETKARRNLVRPKWLTALLLSLSSSRQASYPAPLKDKLSNRRIADCLEMLTPRKAGAGDQAGRKTGSLAWRLARGELGTQPAAGHVFKPSIAEKEEGVMVVEYCVKDNKYYRGTGRELAHISMEEKDGGEGFLRGAHTAENVARKVEADWDKVYLARTEGSQEKGSISWKISLEDNLEVGKVEVIVQSTTFHGGKVLWQLCTENQCLLPQPGLTLETEQLSGNRELTLTATLSGGNTDTGVAWQHAQLFRRSRSGEAEPQMRIKVFLKKGKA